MQQTPDATFDFTSLHGQSAFLLTGLGPGESWPLATRKLQSAGICFAYVWHTDENIGGAANPNVAFSGSYTISRKM